MVNTTDSAWCRLSTHLDWGDLRVQLTTTGSTPQHTVTHFRQLRAAMQAQSQPPSFAQLTTLVMHGLQRATEAQDWPLAERLAKAVALVLAQHVEPGNRLGLFCVGSITHPGQYYEVEEETCSCPDFRFQHHCCKHILASQLWKQWIIPTEEGS